MKSATKNRTIFMYHVEYDMCRFTRTTIYIFLPSILSLRHIPKRNNPMKNSTTLLKEVIYLKVYWN